MLIINSIILAIIQGITEFLPISSSGHLVVLHQLLDFSAIDNLTFDVALHLGTALALIIFFRKQILKYLIAFGSMFRYFNIAKDEQKTVLNLIIATIPAALAGYFLESYIEQYLRNILIVAIALIIGGFLFFIVEKLSQKKLDYESLAIPEALAIGLAQTLALIPGVSRSGITIITGMSVKLNRAQAAQFSFLLSIPIVLGAGLKKIFDIKWQLVSGQELYLLLIGFVVSFAVGYFVIKYFLRFVQKKSLNVFGVYRILLGLIIVILLVKNII